MKMLLSKMATCLGGLLFLGLSSEHVRADLINPLIIDNKPLRFEANVENIGLTASAIVLGGTDLQGFSGNWSAVIQQSTFDAAGVNNDIQFELFHNIAPDPALLEQAPNLVLKSPPGLFNVVPGALFPGLVGSADHGRVHEDAFHITYAPLAAGVSSLLTIQMVHTPEPSTLFLLASGLAGLAGFASRSIWKRV